MISVFFYLQIYQSIKWWYKQWYRSTKKKCKSKFIFEEIEFENLADFRFYINELLDK